MAEKRESNKFKNGESIECPVCGSKKLCRCYVPPTIESDEQGNKSKIGQLTVDIDCSEALKGLKAITREAKKATEALKELEEQQKKMSSSVVIRHES